MGTEERRGALHLFTSPEIAKNRLIWRRPRSKGSIYVLLAVHSAPVNPSQAHFSGDLVTHVSNADESVTSLLREWANGHTAAGSQLFTLVYDELRTVARRQRRLSHEDTLNTTALVHEVYLRLNAATALNVQDRAHFYAIAAQATRQILSNYARRGRTDKRGSGTVPLTLDDRQVQQVVLAPDPELSIDRLWDLELALRQLHTMRPRACQVVECRFFGGLSIPDTAVALGISEATVKRDWALAQAWLCRELRQHAGTS